MTASREACGFRLIVFDLDGTLVDSRRDIAESANALLESCGARAAARGAHRPHGWRRRGDARRARVRRGGVERPADALDRFLAIYNDRLLEPHRPYPGMLDVLDVLGGACDARRADEQAARLDAPRFSRGSTSRGISQRTPSSAATDRFPRKPDPAGLRHLIVGARTSRRRRCWSAIRSIDWRTARAAATPCVSPATGSGSRVSLIDELGPARSCRSIRPQSCLHL